MGDLQKIIDRGEYLPLRSVSVFESNFIQVNRRGESIYLHNRPNYVAMGVCASSPNLSLPNMMLLAHTAPVSSRESFATCSTCTESSFSDDTLVLTRFLPLKYVNISIHSVTRNRIKLKLISGRAYYLELSGPPQKQTYLFRHWMRLINLLNSKNPDASIIFKNFDMQKERNTFSNTPWKNPNSAVSSYSVPRFLKPYVVCSLPSPKRSNQELYVQDQEKKKEPEKAPILKQISSKRVTISEIVGPIEQIGKSRGQETVSSYALIRKSSVSSEKQNKQPQALRKNDTKKKSREREPSYSGKRLQTSGILKNASKSEVVYYK